MSRSVLVGRTAPVVDFNAQIGEASTGYTLSEQPVTYTALPTGTSVVTGHADDVYLDLPFVVTLYGEPYDWVGIHTGGYVDFLNAYLYPFSGDWEVDGSSAVLTGVRGTAPNRQYVIEWRNVRPYNDASTRFTFQAIIDEAGGVSFAYPSNDGTFIRGGGVAKVGIECKDPWVPSITYSEQLPVLRPGYGIHFQPSVS